MLPLHYTKFGTFRENIISRATSGGRREIELNSGSFPPVPGGLATLGSTPRAYVIITDSEQGAREQGFCWMGLTATGWGEG